MLTYSNIYIFTTNLSWQTGYWKVLVRTTTKRVTIKQFWKFQSSFTNNTRFYSWIGPILRFCQKFWLEFFQSGTSGVCRSPPGPSRRISSSAVPSLYSGSRERNTRWSLAWRGINHRFRLAGCHHPWIHQTLSHLVSPCLSPCGVPPSLQMTRSHQPETSGWGGTGNQQWMGI